MSSEPATHHLTATNSAGYAAPVGLTADPVVFTLSEHGLSVLLVRRGDAPFAGAWRLPGGFVGHAESSQTTVARKLAEKTGMRDIYLEQLRTYDAPDRDLRGWLPTVAYLALVPADALPEGSDGAWHPVAALPSLAFDHGAIIADGLARLRGKLWHSNVAMGLLPERFAMREAREVYEAITAAAQDPGNFTRRLRNSGLLRATGARRHEGRGRPAELFEWSSREPAWVPAHGD